MKPNVQMKEVFDTNPIGHALKPILERFDTEEPLLFALIATALLDAYNKGWEASGK